MRITIDAAPLLVRSAGVKNYLYYWIEHLQQECRGDEIRLFPFLGRLGRLDHEGSAAGRTATLARLGLLFLLNRSQVNVSGWAAPRSDIFHACKLLQPPGRTRLTATVHDVTCWLLPETHSAANVAGDHVFAERILRRADGLITPSEATRQDVIRVLKLSPEKIHVIHHGIAEPFFNVQACDAQAVRSRYGLEHDYFLFVGSIEPRKNIDLLLNAYEQLSPAARNEFHLILAGPLGWAQEKTILRIQNPPPGVRYLGYVPEPDLPGLMAGATAFVYPSLYEGFGFPVAQAMAAGTPVITSSVSALPEVSGDAALLVDPRSERELVEGMTEIITSPARRERMTELGRSNARRFSWRDCAEKSLRFFHHVAG